MSIKKRTETIHLFALKYGITTEPNAIKNNADSFIQKSPITTMKKL